MKVIRFVGNLQQLEDFLQLLVNKFGANATLDELKAKLQNGEVIQIHNTSSKE